MRYLETLCIIYRKNDVAVRKNTDVSTSSLTCLYGSEGQTKSIETTIKDSRLL